MTSSVFDAQQKLIRLPSLVAKCLAWAKIDSSIVPLLVGRMWSVLAGPLTPIIVAHFTTPAQQGLMYTFGSILAVQTMFELGFNQVLLQFVSHEAHQVRRGARGHILHGTKVALSRLRLFLRLGLAWYTLVALLVLAGIGPFGVSFFGPRAGGVEGWEAAWWLMVVSSAVTILVQPLVIMINGLDYVAFINWVRTGSTIVQTVALWLALASGLALKSSAVSAMVGAVLLAIPCLWWFRPLLSALARSPKNDRLGPLFVQIFRLQSKTALTWMTGFFVFQIFNPVLLDRVGAVAAGQFGMTQALLGSAAAFPLAWVQTKLPRIGAFLGKGHAAEARILFRESFIRLVVLSVPAIFGALLVLELFQYFLFSKPRALPLLEGGLLAAGFVLQNISMGMVSYVRAHKQEPFVTMAWAQAIVTTGSLLILTTFIGLPGASIAYVLSWSLALVWTIVIFRRFWLYTP